MTTKFNEYNIPDELESYIKKYWDNNSQLYYDRTYKLLKESVDILDKIVEIYNATISGSIEPKYTFVGFNEIKSCNIIYNRNEKYDYLVIHCNKIETPFGILHITNLDKNNIILEKIIKTNETLGLDESRLEPNMVNTIRNGDILNGYRYKLDYSYNYMVPSIVIKQILETFGIRI